MTKIKNKILSTSKLDSLLIIQQVNVLTESLSSIYYINDNK